MRYGIFSELKKGKDIIHLEYMKQEKESNITFRVKENESNMAFRIKESENFI